MCERDEARALHLRHLAAYLRQLRRAMEAHDAVACEVTSIDLLAQLRSILSRDLARCPHWDSAARWLDAVSNARLRYEGGEPRRSSAPQRRPKSNSRPLVVAMVGVPVMSAMAPWIGMVWPTSSGEFGSGSENGAKLRVTGRNSCTERST